jgi:hypothetical protein
MDNNLTIKTLAFALSFSDKAGSERRDVSRGVNLPTVMSIKSQPYTDSVSKEPGVRTVLRFDMTFAGTGGAPKVVSAYLVTAVPNDPVITSANVESAIGFILGTLDNTSPNLDLVTEIFVNHEQ